jgi:hypothetical protein
MDDVCPPFVSRAGGGYRRLLRLELVERRRGRQRDLERGLHELHERSVRGPAERM